MIKTYGLTHVAFAVRDLARTRKFYEQVFGAVAVYDDESLLQMQTPGARDVMVFQKNPEKAGKAGGIIHFGFRLLDPHSIDDAAAAVENAGGTIIEKGEFCPGQPYIYFHDPDGYEVEIWHEIPPQSTPNPKATSHQTQHPKIAPDISPIPTSPPTNPPP